MAFCVKLRIDDKYMEKESSPLSCTCATAQTGLDENTLRDIFNTRTDSRSC